MVVVVVVVGGGRPGFEELPARSRTGEGQGASLGDEQLLSVQGGSVNNAGQVAPGLEGSLRQEASARRDGAT